MEDSINLQSLIKKDLWAFQQDFETIKSSNASQGFKILCYENLILEMEVVFSIQKLMNGFENIDSKIVDLYKEIREEQEQRHREYEAGERGVQVTS